MAEQITNLGQAINILIQVATMAQSKGILTLTEAVIVKESIDFINKLQEQSEQQAEAIPPVVDETLPGTQEEAKKTK